MKKIIPISLFLFALFSCSHIYFEEVQPSKGVYQTEMPQELFGVWFDDSEGWKVNEEGITNINLETDSLDKVIDTVPGRVNALSDSFQIYKVKDLYVLNYRENSEYWEITIFQPLENGDINVFAISDPKVFAEVKGLKLKSATYTIDDELRTVKTLDPYAESSLKFESAVFSGQMKIRSLKKALKSVTPTVFRSDGTIYEAE